MYANVIIDRVSDALDHVFTYAVPISVFITVGGGLYFLYLLLTRRRV